MRHRIDIEHGENSENLEKCITMRVEHVRIFFIRSANFQILTKFKGIFLEARFSRFLVSNISWMEFNEKTERRNSIRVEQAYIFPQRSISFLHEKKEIHKNRDFATT